MRMEPPRPARLEKKKNMRSQRRGGAGGRLCDELRLRRDETLYAAGQLHPTLDGGFNRIGEIAIVIEHEAEIDERELSRKRLARDRVVDDRQRERADAASHRIWKARVIDGANSGGQLPALEQSRVASPEPLLNICGLH